MATSLDGQPGFRRRFRITPGERAVCSQLEDDYHCMSVVIRHDGRSVTAVQSRMHRAPWTTCPGAEKQLQETFSGVALDEIRSCGGRTAHCTHLYDLVLLAVGHALDAQPLVIDILVSDAVDGVRRAELRRNGSTVLGWTEADMTILAPDVLAGTRLLDLGPWISSLEPEMQESARLLRWGNIMANGRSIPLQQQSDATRMPAGCYTFQPQRAAIARRVGEIRDFSRAGSEPLADIDIMV